METTSLRILAIEDNLDNQVVLKAVLEEALPGSNLLTALSGVEGIELARTEDPDVILLDIVMPGMDGFAVCQKLKEDELLRVIPVIFLTATKSNQESRIKALEVGADAFLSRPLDKFELIIQIRTMAKIKAINQLQRIEAKQLSDLVKERTQELEQSRTRSLKLTQDLKTENAVREKSDLAYKESEEKYRQLFEMESDALFLVDSETGRILDANIAATKLYGYSHDDLLTMRNVDLSGEPVETKKATENLVVNIPLRFHKKKDGSLFPVEITATHITFNNRPAHIPAIRDISERIKAESDLRLKNRSIESAPNGIAFADLEGLITYVNPAFLKMWGYVDENECIGKKLIGFWRVPDNDSELAGTQQQNGDWFGEMTAQRRDGTDFIVEVSTSAVMDDYGQPVCTQSSFVDISDRKRVEEALQKSEAIVRNKLQAITEPEGDIGMLELSDIIDTELLESIMEDFYQLTGMLGAVLDVSGNVLVAVGWQDICTKFHRCNPETLKNCIESDTILTNGVPAGTFKAYHCKNHMWDIVTPLMVGGRHIGNVFIGQFFHQGEMPDVELFRKQARTYGFDETEYMAALDRVPHFSKKTVDVGMRFYAKLAGIFSTLSFNSIQQSRMLADQKLSAEKLKRQEEEYRTLSENSPDMITRFDKQLRYTYINASAASIGTLFPQEYIGRTLEEAGVSEQERTFWNERYQKVFTTGESLDIEHEFFTADGLRTFNTRLIAEYSPDGSVQSVLSLARDITERKQNEKRLASQLDELHRWYEVMLGREDRILELKDEVNALLAQSGKPPHYAYHENIPGEDPEQSNTIRS